VWEFEAYNLGSGRHLATAQQTMVQVDLDSRQPMPVGEDFREAIGRFDKEVQTA
jgi:acyl-CoA thioesterase FadM